MIAWWVAAALAAPPNRWASTLADDSGGVDRVVVSSGGAYVAAVGGGQVRLVDTGDWSVELWNPCAAVAAAVVERDDGDWLLVGCSDGTVHRLEVDGDGTAAETWTLETDELVGLWWNPDASAGASIWAAGKVSSTTLGGESVRLYAFEPQDDSAPTTYDLGYQGYVDGELVGAALYVAHSNGLMSRQPLAGGSATGSSQTFGLNVADIAASTRAVFTVGSDGNLGEYDPVQFNLDVLRTGLGSLDAVGSSLEDSPAWMVTAAGDQYSVWTLESGLPSADPLETFTGPLSASDIVAVDGYGFVASSSGLGVLTARPWVDDVAVDVDTLLSGDTFELTFKSDTSGTYELRLGGGISRDGTLLSSGTVAADATVAATLTVGETFAEGDNRLWVFVEDDDGEIGRGAAVVTVDNAPGAVVLPDSALGVANRSLKLSFDGLADADLQRYDVYVTTAPFDPTTFATGGPAFDGTDALTTPIVVETSGGASVASTISPLTNGVTYYVAVRAVDAGGKEGPLSNVVSGTPVDTLTASALAGERGGTGCSTASGSGWGASMIAFGLLGLRRRRAVAAVAVAVALSGSSAAHAGSFLGKDIDLSKQRGNFEMRYGGIRWGELGNEEDDVTDLEKVYGSTNNNLMQFEAGPQLWGLFELDAGFGFIQELAFTLDADGNATSERTMITAYPMSVGGTVRLQLFDEQIIVPHARYGADYYLWNEKWDNGTGGKNKVSGTKYGRHYAFGGSLLLDVFAPARASLLEANSGINDTSIIFEWRRYDQEGGRSGLDFSGTAFTVGLKLDY